MLRETSIVVLEEINRSVGYYQPASGPFEAWAQLADITKSNREAAGFPPNEPELVTGTLRNSYRGNYDDRSVCVGSDDPIAAEQEFGTVKMPARSIVGGALVRRLPEIVNMMASYLAQEVTSREIPIRHQARTTAVP
jgi:hypothetical protein